MAISDTARRNHDELFPGRVSTLARTDPELIEHFDNFAFDEVISDSDLDIRTRLMVQLASLIASHAVSEFRVMAGAGLTIGLTPVELKEIVYQAVPYVGMAKVFDFLHATNDVLTERGCGCHCRARPPPLRRHGSSAGWPCRSGSWAASGSTPCTTTHPMTSNICSVTCRPTASVTT